MPICITQHDHAWQKKSVAWKQNNDICKEFHAFIWIRIADSQCVMSVLQFFSLAMAWQKHLCHFRMMSIYSKENIIIIHTVGCVAVNFHRLCNACNVFMRFSKRRESIKPVLKLNLCTHCRHKQVNLFKYRLHNLLALRLEILLNFSFSFLQIAYKFYVYKN